MVHRFQYLHYIVVRLNQISYCNISYEWECKWQYSILNNLQGSLGVSRPANILGVLLAYLQTGLWFPDCNSRACLSTKDGPWIYFDPTLTLCGRQCGTDDRSDHSHPWQALQGRTLHLSQTAIIAITLEYQAWHYLKHTSKAFLVSEMGQFLMRHPQMTMKKAISTWIWPIDL